MVDILGSIDDKIENNEKKASEILNFSLSILEKFYTLNKYEKKQLSDCLQLLKDGTHNPPKRVDVGIPLITGQTIEKGVIDYNKMTYIKESDYQKIHSKYCPMENDLLITKIGTLGKVAILRKKDIPIAVHCNSALLRFKDINPAVAFFVLNSRAFQNEIHQKKNRTVQEFINLEQIGNLDILIPELSSIEEKQFEMLLGRISQINIENSKLNELKQLYLKKFFG